MLDLLRRDFCVGLRLKLYFIPKLVTITGMYTVITVIICVILRRVFKHCLRRLSTDFLETLRQDVGSSAIENVPFAFSLVPLKEICGRKPHF